MPHHELLGRVVTLTLRRFGPPGAFLAVPEPDEPEGAHRERPDTILLPGGEWPEGALEGDALEVFVHLDSEDRPIATTRTPLLTLGEVAFLRVTDLAPFGAFVDWGLPKELLVPHGEQTFDVRIGERHPFGLVLDDTGRLAGTMRVREMVRSSDDFELDEWVSGEAWRKEPGLGVFVIVERKYLALLPESEPHALSRGDAAQFRVASILPDGKIELSLRGHAHEEAPRDAERVLELLSRPGAPSASDRSSPELIRQHFGLSKKAFKRAVGRLLRDGAVDVTEDGLVVPRRPNAR